MCRRTASRRDERTIIAQRFAAVGGKQQTIGGLRFTPIHEPSWRSGVLRERACRRAAELADVYNVCRGHSPDSTQALPVGFSLISGYSE